MITIHQIAKQKGERGKQAREIIKEFQLSPSKTKKMLKVKNLVRGSKKY